MKQLQMSKGAKALVGQVQKSRRCSEQEAFDYVLKTALTRLKALAKYDRKLAAKARTKSAKKATCTYRVAS